MTHETLFHLIGRFIYSASGLLVRVCRRAGIEWDILNDEVKELYRTGKYGRAVVVAKKALEVAEENVGPYHYSVAMSLNNLALLYDTQGH